MNMPLYCCFDTSSCLCTIFINERTRVVKMKSANQLKALEAICTNIKDTRDTLIICVDKFFELDEMIATSGGLGFQLLHVSFFRFQIAQDSCNPS